MAAAVPTAGSPRLSVVIPTLGNHEVLGRVLSGYERQDAPEGSFELLVVSDAQEPDPAAVHRTIGRRPYPVRWLTGSRPGASANRNTGWMAARSPLVLFTDSDTVPVPRLVSEHLASHAAHPEPELAVAGLVRWAPGLKVTPFMRWLEQGLQFDFGSLRGEQGSWAHLYGANASIKRELLQRVGGYDEINLPYGYEDLDWGLRAREHGLRVLFNRRAVVDHWRPMTVEHWKARAARLAVSEWRFCQLHPEIEPWFWRLFSEAAAQPRGLIRGRGSSRHLVAWTPRWLPWLGPRVWERAGWAWRQEIAPYFLAAWEEAARGNAELQPAFSALAERGENPSGSWPGGPK